MLFMPENVIKGIFHLWENEGSMEAKMKKKISTWNLLVRPIRVRSEERRVGKEGRSRWAP